jgi:hypothetical protein
MRRDPPAPRLRRAGPHSPSRRRAFAATATARLRAKARAMTTARLRFVESRDDRRPGQRRAGAMASAEALVCRLGEWLGTVLSPSHAVAKLARPSCGRESRDQGARRRGQGRREGQPGLTLCLSQGDNPSASRRFVSGRGGGLLPVAQALLPVRGVSPALNLAPPQPTPPRGAGFQPARSSALPRVHPATRRPAAPSLPRHLRREGSSLEPPAPTGLHGARNGEAGKRLLR